MMNYLLDTSNDSHIFLFEFDIQLNSHPTITGIGKVLYNFEKIKSPVLKT